MKNKVIISLSFLAILFVGFNPLKDNLATNSRDTIVNNFQDKSQEYKHWSIQKLSDSLSNRKLSQLTFMDENSMKGTYIEIKKGEAFQREAVTDDIYYLYEGSCSVNLSNANQTFDKGDVIFAKKGSDFRIENSEKFLQIVLVSMVLPSNSKTKNWKHFSKTVIEEARISDENQWNPFIMYSNVIFGMYMLPEIVDGDDRLVHPWQELNIISSGSSDFVMDTGTIAVEKGSIIFVEEGNGHYFNALKEDMDILILWEQRNVSHDGY